MRTTVALALLAGLLVQCATAAPGKNADILQTLKDDGLNKYLEILDAANAAKALGASANISTVFAASDVAIDKWLKSHNMTMEDLKKREALADRIIAYSVILGEPGLVDDIKPGQKVQVPTLANGWHITVWRDDEGKLYMNDADGDVVSVPDTFKKGSEARVHEVNHLMLPGTVFSDPLSYSFDVIAPNGTLVKQRQLETFKAAVKRAGITDIGNNDLTVFVPTDEAFKSAGITPETISKMDPAQVKDLLYYHTIPGYVPFPNPAIGGKPVATKFGGHTLKLSEKVNKTADGAVSTVYVTDETGKTAEVVAPNFFSGKLTFHIIDKPLSAAKAAAAPAAAAAEPAAAAKPAAEPEAAKAGARKLLQMRGGASTAALFAQNNAMGAIESAVDDASPAATMGATRTGQANTGMVAYPVTQKFLYTGITTNF